jgi:hypothetical protein
MGNMNLNSIWSTLEESFDILGGYGYPAMDKVVLELALPPDYFTWVAAIWLFGSEPFTTAQFMRMFPFGLARLNEERFTSAMQQGYLMSNGVNGYSPTEDGWNVARKMWRTAGDSIAHLPIPSETDLHKLFTYLTRIADASLAAPEPPPHFSISHKRKNYGRFGTNNSLEDFVVRFGELAAYRDDSHNAAWQAYRLEGHAWEAFDQLSHDGALPFDRLYSKLQGRGLPQEVYTDDLQELCKRGWIEENAGEYQVTAEGKRIREKVEALTDYCFFAPWSCLSESESTELFLLAAQLRDRLKNSVKGGMLNRAAGI